MGGRYVRYPEASLHFILHETRSALESLVAVFIKYGRMMFLRVFAAFGHEKHQAVELRVSVVGIVHMSR